MRHEPFHVQPLQQLDHAGAAASGHDAADALVLEGRVQLVEAALDAAGGEAAPLEQALGRLDFEAQTPQLGDAALEPLRFDGARRGADRDEVPRPQRWRLERQAPTPARSRISRESAQRSAVPAAARARLGSGAT